MDGSEQQRESDEQELIQLQRSLATVYKVERLLIRRGALVVYQAAEINPPRPVALRMLPAELRASAATARFREVARPVMLLNHASIVPIYRVGFKSGAPYFVATKLVDGHALDEIVASQGPLPVPVIVAVLRTAAAAFGFAHSHGTLHGAFASSCVLVDRNGQVMVWEFGFSRLVEEAVGAAGAPPRHVSPEEAAGGPATPLGDQFALGMTALEMLTGSAQATGDPLTALGEVRAARVSLPEALRSAVATMLTPDPGGRFRTTPDMLAAVNAIPFSDADGREAAVTLGRLARGEPVPKLRPLAPPPAAKPAPEPRRAPAAAAKPAPTPPPLPPPALPAVELPAELAPAEPAGLWEGASSLPVGLPHEEFAPIAPAMPPAPPAPVAPARGMAPLVSAAEAPLAPPPPPPRAPPSVPPPYAAEPAPRVSRTTPPLRRASTLAAALPERRSRLPLALAAVVVVAALGAGGFFVLRQRAAPAPLAQAPGEPQAPPAAPSTGPSVPVAAESTRRDAARTDSGGGTGLLLLSAVPATANIFVDGKPSGSGGFVDSEVTAGRLRLEIMAPGYEALDTVVTVRPGRSLDLGRIQLLRSDAGRIELRVVPGNATIFIDGEQVGVGSLTDVEVTGGPRRLRISAPGYVTLDTSITVVPGTINLLGLISLTSAPGGP